MGSSKARDGTKSVKIKKVKIDKNFFVILHLKVSKRKAMQYGSLFLSWSSWIDLSGPRTSRSSALTLSCTS